MRSHHECGSARAVVIMLLSLHVLPSLLMKKYRAHQEGKEAAPPALQRRLHGWLVGRRAGHVRRVPRGLPAVPERQGAGMRSLHGWLLDGCRYPHLHQGEKRTVGVTTRT